MVWNVNEVAKSNEYSRESVKEISREDIKNVEELKNYYNQASEDEKQRLNNEFSQNLRNELNNDPELKSALEWEEIIDSEIRDDDTKNLENLKTLQNTLDAYPNLPEANRKAVEDMVYGPFKNSEEEIKNVLSGEDKNIDNQIEL